MNFQPSTLVLLIGSACIAGCVSTPKGAAYGYEEEIRAQLIESSPVRELGYTIEDIRFSPDYTKVLVVLEHPDREERPPWEIVLREDEFNQYIGSGVQPFYTPGTARTHVHNIKIVLPAE